MLAIRAARLFDGFDLVRMGRPVVTVDSGRIVGVSARPPHGVPLEDLGDVTLLPGLVDAHTHLVLDASPDPIGRLATVDDGALLVGARTAARRALSAGITTLRDLGDRGYVAVRLRDEFAGSPGTGPRILAAGPPITTTGGHCWFLGGEADGVEGVRAAVRERAERGVDVIKVMATGGEITPGTRAHEAQYGPDELRAIADEAHRRGLPTTAHAHGAPGIANALAAGFDMIEHCSFLTADGAEADDGLIDGIRRNGVVVSATLGYLPGPPLPPRAAALGDRLTTVLQRVLSAGVQVVTSSDAGIGPRKPHDVLPYAAAMLVDVIGAIPLAALRSVTSLAGAACRAPVGRIAPGLDADLVAVRGDPVTDITALRSVAAVFRAGRRVPLAPLRSDSR